MKKTSAMRNDEEQSKGYKRRKWLRVASTITAVVSVIAFFLTEDITLAMVLVDRWTLLMAAFLIVQNWMITKTIQKPLAHKD